MSVDPADDLALSDDEVDPTVPDPITPVDPEWLTFEKDVTKLLASMDDSGTVEHNHKRTGKSGRPRQIDTLVTGTICGIVMQIGVEAKRYKSKVGIGVIDAFVGKCLDTGVDRGVMYSYKGFDAGAHARADWASSPKIELRTLPDPTATDESEYAEPTPWDEILPDFLDYKRCPAKTCWGDVLIRHDLQWDGGVCDQCALPSGQCVACEEFQCLESDDQPCYSCDSGHFMVSREPDSQEVTNIHWTAGIWDHEGYS